MVTVGSIQPSTLQAFQGSMTYDDALSFRSLELALDDVASMPATTIPAEEQVHAAQKQQQQQKQEPAPPTRRRSISVVTPVDRSGLEEYQQQRHEDRPRVPPTYTPSSATHRLFRAAKPEPARSWKFRPANDGNTVFKGESGIDSSCSWRAAENGAPSGVIGDQQDTANNNTHFGARSPMHNTNSSSRGGREERPQNEILDGSDVLQQISNLTSTEPSNEREVFVGGLRESEDAVHITEEELATYFSKFGVIESVSINRDDRTHRGRGFAFVKFFQEAAALNAVVADASTHVIRGTTVSVQWSRGAKDGGDRPRRRNSNTSASSGSSPSRGGSRTSPKTGLFSNGQKRGHHRGGGGGGGGGSCGSATCSHGYSPHRSRSQGHLSVGTSAGSMSPYSYCGGGHGTDHMNQPMVCVVVPAQRAAALGLQHHPTHSLSSHTTHSMSSCSSRCSSMSGDMHFVPLGQGGSSGHSSIHPSHTRSHSHTPTSTSSSGNNGTAGGGYNSHYTSLAAEQQHHHSVTVPHHVAAQKTSSLYGGGHPPVHMPPIHQQGLSHRRGRDEPRRIPSGTSHKNSVGDGGYSSYADYEGSQYELSLHSNNSYPPQEWNGDIPVARSMRQCAIRSQSPPSGVHNAPQGQGRSGGGAPRPPPVASQAYDSHYLSNRYTTAPGLGPGSAIDGFTAGISSSGRRHSGSSVMNQRRSALRDGLAPSSHSYFSPNDRGTEHAYDGDYGYVGPSRMI